jgi:hypothetical protein
MTSQVLVTEADGDKGMQLILFECSVIGSSFKVSGMCDAQKSVG